MRNIFRDFLISFKNYKRNHSIKNKDFTIISNNCIGGVIYHSLKLQFLSPTINLWFYPEDFLKFVENLNHYLQLEMVEVSTELPYPVGLLGDIFIYFQHYSSFEEAKKKWDERKKRMTKKIVVFMTETEEFKESYFARFEKLTYKRVLFVSRQRPEYPHTYFIPGTSKQTKTQYGVINLLSFKNKFSSRRYLDDFDYITFLNGF